MTARLENLEEVIPKSLISKQDILYVFKNEKVNYVLIEIELLRLNTFKILENTQFKSNEVETKERKYI